MRIVETVSQEVDRHQTMTKKTEKCRKPRLHDCASLGPLLSMYCPVHLLVTRQPGCSWLQAIRPSLLSVNEPSFVEEDSRPRHADESLSASHRVYLVVRCVTRAGRVASGDQTRLARQLPVSARRIPVDATAAVQLRKSQVRRLLGDSVSLLASRICKPLDASIEPA